VTTAAYVFGSYLFGVAYAYLVVRFYEAISAKRPIRAAGFDLLIMTLALAPMQFWAWAGADPLVLVGEVIGSATGTYFAVKRSN
jgi:hypothetical protein